MSVVQRSLRRCRIAQLPPLSMNSTTRPFSAAALGASFDNLAVSAAVNPPRGIQERGRLSPGGTDVLCEYRVPGSWKVEPGRPMGSPWAWSGQWWTAGTYRTTGAGEVEATMACARRAHVDLRDSGH